MSEKKPDALLPCPFCGADNPTVRELVEGAYWTVQCSNEHLRYSASTASWESAEDAIAAWNTRHTDTEVLRRCEDEPKNAETQLKAWVEGFMLGLRQQGMDRWEAKKRVLETAEKWHPERYSILKGAPDDWFY